MLQSHALQQLYKVVDKFWAEVAGSVPLIEELSEDPKFEVTAGSADKTAKNCQVHWVLLP